MYASWHQHEQNRLDAEIRHLAERLDGTVKRPGLRSRSKHSFLRALLAHKRDRLSTLQALADDTPATAGKVALQS